MLRVLFSRNAGRLTSQVETVCQMRTFSALGGLKGYDDKEGAEEAIYFRKEDEKLLKHLLDKVRTQAEKHDVHGAAGVRTAELSALNAIVGSKLSDAEKDAVIEWKHKHF